MKHKLKKAIQKPESRSSEKVFASFLKIRKIESGLFKAQLLDLGLFKIDNFWT